MQVAYVSTLEERIAVTVAHANQLVAWLPFQITEMTTDPVDERIGYVRIRCDDGQEYASILTMVWLSPALIADAALRAFIYEMTAEELDRTLEQQADDAPQPRPVPKRWVQ